MLKTSAKKSENITLSNHKKKKKTEKNDMFKNKTRFHSQRPEFED